MAPLSTDRLHNTAEHLRAGIRRAIRSEHWDRLRGLDARLWPVLEEIDSRDRTAASKQRAPTGPMWA
jgi:hypothetical protein